MTNILVGYCCTNCRKYIQVLVMPNCCTFCGNNVNGPEGFLAVYSDANDLQIGELVSEFNTESNGCVTAE